MNVPGTSTLALWLTKLEPVHRATTQAEREAAYRLRYDAYVGELRRQFPWADHERKWLFDEDDDHAGTTILYTGTPRGMTGTIRLRTWPPGEVPAKQVDRLSLDLFPDIGKLTTAYLGYLSVRPEVRGRLILPALLRAAYEHLAGERKVDLAFLQCSPGHLRHYRRLGAVPYGGRLVAGSVGTIQIPLVVVLSDAARLRRARSFVAPLVKKHFGPGKRAALDTAPFRHVLEPERPAVEMDPAKVWQAVRTSLDGSAAPTLTQTLAPATLKRLSESGFILNVREGEQLIRMGESEREVYVILEGAFEIHEGPKRIALCTKGDLIGEIAFFTGSGERTASARAATDGQVLVLRRRFLRELTHSEPEAGYRLLMHMSRVMAERLLETTRA